MTRSTLLALALVSAALLAVLASVAHLVERDRNALVQRFAADHASRLAEAVREIEADLDDVAEDLRFAGELVLAADSAADREREIRALLAVVRAYRAVQVFDASARSILEVADPLGGPREAAASSERTMARLAATALRGPPGTLEVSSPIGVAPDDWYRVFAGALPRAAGPDRPAAITILVDTEPIFGRLRLVAAEASTKLLLLGPHGHPMPSSDRRIARDLRTPRATSAVPSIRLLRERMLSGATGSVRIQEREAERLSLGHDEVIAVFAPIEVPGGGHWSVATFTSLVALRTHERAIFLRFGVASAAICLCLVAFAGWMIRTTRRSIAIRERLHHAEQLAHLHEKTDKILESIPTGVLALSDEGHLTAANRAMRDRIPATAIGLPIDRAFPDASPSAVEQLRALIDAARTTGSTRSRLGERIALFGREGQYNLHAVGLESRDREARVLLVIEDLSDVRSLESQLLRAEKLATVGVLAAGIAHEIGTPLGVVRGRAEYLLGKLGAEHPQSPGVRVIVEQIDQVTRTIRQLLDFSRVRPAVVRTVDLPPQVRGVAELLRYEAGRRKIAIRVELPDDLPRVAADPDQLQQVLVNLVMNACDACEVGGLVNLSARCVAGGVTVLVADDGCGIAAQDLHRVFDPFFTTKKRGQGTGLGLTMAAQIVRNHGGRIEIESVPGRGTCVSVFWPASPVEASSTGAVRAPDGAELTR